METLPPSRAASTGELDELQKSRAKVESQVISIKNNISTVGRSGVADPEKAGELQCLQNQIKQLEEFVQMGKKKDEECSRHNTSSFIWNLCRHPLRFPAIHEKCKGDEYDAVSLKAQKMVKRTDEDAEVPALMK